MYMSFFRYNGKYAFILYLTLSKAELNVELNVYCKQEPVADIPSGNRSSCGYGGLEI